MDYTREPFIYRPGNVRVTFDYDIRTGLHSTDFLDPDCVTIPAGDAPILMEVKWDAFLPAIIRDLVQTPDGTPRPFPNTRSGRIYGKTAANQVKIKEKNTVTFSDIFKSSFLENVDQREPAGHGPGARSGLRLGMFIFLIYKKTFAGVMYSSSFGVSLVALTMITTLVILAVTSNVVLSLGMVGALSIVRFRTGDQGAAGHRVPVLVHRRRHRPCGGPHIPLAVIGSVVIGLILLVFANRKSHANPYIVVLSCRDRTGETEATQLLAEHTQRWRVQEQDRPRREDRAESGGPPQGRRHGLRQRPRAAAGVDSAVLVSYHGDYMG